MAGYKPNIIRPNSREEWLKAREDGIGASEVASVIGLSPWDSPFSLWLKKTGQVPPVEETVAMHMGHLLEPVIAQLWIEHTGGKIVKASEKDIIYQDPEHPWRKVTPDRIASEINPETGKKGKCLLEFKSTSQDFDPEDPPIYYVAQCQYQMHVTGIHVDYLCWLTNGRYYNHSRLTYDKEFAEYIVGRVDEFYLENIKKLIEPDLITVSDWNNKGSSEGVSVEADSEAVDDIEELRMVNTSISELEARQETLKDKLKLFMREAETLTDENGNVLATWKSGKKGRTFLLKKNKEQ